MKTALADLWHFSREVIGGLRWVMHPITVFVALQIVSVSVLAIWVVWFLRRQEELSIISKKLGTQYFEGSTALGALIAGCILVGVILVGTVVLFVSGQQKALAVRQQQRFISSVTHELRSPLSSLQLAFETLQSRSLDDTTRNKFMTMAVSDIQRLSRLVDQILISARINRGVMLFEDDTELLNPTEEITRICAAASHLDQNIMNRISIKTGNIRQLKASRHALSLILGNLIENAIKYSESGTPIAIELNHDDEKLTVTVSDRGFGLDKREIRKIFRIFHRAETAARKAVPGTGLGLYIVKSTARLLEGDVWAESNGLGKGAKFVVQLPRSKRLEVLT